MAGISGADGKLSQAKREVTLGFARNMEVHMILATPLAEKGFSLEKAFLDDFPAYMAVKKACYQKYVDEYYGGWIDGVQFQRNTDVFSRSIRQTCFQKIMLNDRAVGFFGYDVLDDRIDGVSIQMLEEARNQGIGSFFLQQIVQQSDRLKKPIFLKVFRSNPAQRLYQRVGFVIYDASSSHYFMRYDPD